MVRDRDGRPQADPLAVHCFCWECTVGSNKIDDVCICVNTIPSLDKQTDRQTELKGSMKEPNILIYLFFRTSLNRVLFPMFCLLVEGECQILVF